MQPARLKGVCVGGEKKVNLWFGACARLYSVRSWFLFLRVRRLQVPDLLYVSSMLIMEINNASLTPFSIIISLTPDWLSC